MSSNVRSVMPDSLLGPRLKVERAKRHLSDFDQALGVFFKTDPYELVTERDPRTGDEVYRVRIHRCLPDELSIIAGDVVHNLRSALDQMVCGLVRANGRQVSGGNGFPIMGSPKRFEEAAVGKLKNLSAKSDRFVRRLKPYKGANDALWMLSELDNMDKHNQIVPVAAGRVRIQRKIGVPGLFLLPDGRLGFGGAPEGSVPFGWQFGWMTPDDSKVVTLLQDNTEIYRVGPQLAEFPSDTQVALQITFGKTAVTDNEVILEVLDGLIKLVERIIDIVERRIL